VSIARQAARRNYNPNIKSERPISIFSIFAGSAKVFANTNCAMTQNTKRSLILPALLIFALVVVGVLYVCHRRAQSHPSQSQVEALNDALKNGLLTKSQYDAEMKKLKDKSQPNPQPQSPQSTP
jgi:hypothetical protein